MKKILITGGSGLVGSAIQKIQHNFSEYQFIFLSSSTCDLTNYQDTLDIFLQYQPHYVIHLAACVGGLFKNMSSPVEMIEKNLAINSNVLKCSHAIQVEKCISCLSTCIFPDKTKYPINETMLHDGPPHNSNYGYAYAKRMLEIQSRAYQEQYGDNFICIIPTNIYGPNDNFNLQDSHVIPALIHKCFLAKQNSSDFIVKGSGKPLRQFIYSIDLANLIMWVLTSYHKKTSLILSVDELHEVSIQKIAELIVNAFDFKGQLIFDNKYSDGQYKKTADNQQLMSLIQQFNFTDISKGIHETVKWFVENYENCRK